MEPALSTSDATLSTERLVEVLRETFDDPGYQPPVLPGAWHKLLALSADPDVAIEDVAGAIAQDPILAADVLRKARSSYYASRFKVATLQEAVMRLGLATMKRLFLLACVDLRLFNAPMYREPMEALREHATATGLAADLIARKTRIDGDGFLIGLLHDVGAAVAFIALAEGSRSPIWTLDQAMPVVESLHCEIGGRVADLWKLPDEVRQAIWMHHGPVGDSKTLALLNVAERAAVLADAPGLDMGSASYDEALKLLNLTDKDVVAVAREVTAIVG